MKKSFRNTILSYRSIMNRRIELRDLNATIKYLRIQDKKRIKPRKLGRYIRIKKKESMTSVGVTNHYLVTHD